MPKEIFSEDLIAILGMLFLIWKQELPALYKHLKIHLLKLDSEIEV